MNLKRLGSCLVCLELLVGNATEYICDQYIALGSFAAFWMCHGCFSWWVRVRCIPFYLQSHLIVTDITCSSIMVKHVLVLPTDELISNMIYSQIDKCIYVMIFIPRLERWDSSTITSIFSRGWRYYLLLSWHWVWHNWLSEICNRISKANN